MSETSGRSDASRSARACTTAPGSTSVNASNTMAARGSIPIHLNVSQTGALMTSANVPEATGGDQSGLQDTFTRADQSNSMSSIPIDTSVANFNRQDGGENRFIPARKSSSRPTIFDRRKLFDATTPTLIDEDDSEMLSLENARIRGNSIGELNEQLLRRTPGTNIYRSTFDPTPEEAMNLNNTSVGSHSSTASVPLIKQQDVVTDQSTADPLGLGYDIHFASAIVGNRINKQNDPDGRDAQRNVPWDSSRQGDRQVHGDRTSSIDAIASRSDVTAGGPFQTHSTPLLGGPHESQVASNLLETRGPFSFESWPKSSKEFQSQQIPINSDDVRAGTSGTFSPNMYRLTENIGNLLQEDEDDDFALEMPSVFTGDSILDIGASNEDWTGSYVFESDIGRRSTKPAVPSRSTNIGNQSLGQRENRARRRSSGMYGSNQPGLLPNAQQPKPRMRSGNEVFEFGRPSESSQVLNFGGAFAPPVVFMGNNSEYARPLQSTSLQNMPTFPEIRTGTPNQHQSMPFQHQQHLQARGNFQVGVNSASSGSSFHSNSQLIQGNISTNYNAPYFLHQPIMFDSSGVVPSHRMHQPVSHGTQYSEMHASAREFVPKTTMSVSQYNTELQHWQQGHHVSSLPPYEPSMEFHDWQGQNMNYDVGTSYAYGMTPLILVDPRSSMTPSPHIPQWSHVPQSHAGHLQQPSQQQQSPQREPEQIHPPQVDPNSLLNPGLSTTKVAEPCNHLSGSNKTSSSPHPSIAGSEHSQGAVPLNKKESKRKQRGKKKPVKSESPLAAKKPVVFLKSKGSKLEPSRPGSTPHSVDVHDCAKPLISEDPNDSKRSELNESPATKAAFKEFYRTIRSEERLSFQKAEEYALSSLTNRLLPESVHWKVYLELADLAKRSNRYVEARMLYKKVCTLQPYASQGWLEYSKLEEECGHMIRVMNILHSGLEYCKYSESLLTRAVKHQEKMGNLDSARELLARLKHVGIEKVWRTVLEGALLEARAGNVSTARRVLKYLMYHVPWYGPLYLEAYCLEKDQGHSIDALNIVERGLQAIPRYGPLWFAAFRLCEDIDRSKKLYNLPQTMDMIERASVTISKELVWKVHLEAAQMLERAAIEQVDVENPQIDDLLIPARRRLAMTVLTCPNNLRWKVWLAAARMELGVGNTDRARLLFLRAHKVVPKKGRSSTLLESARLEDFIGDTNLARAILCKGRLIFGHDWKVWLESVLLEIRSGNNTRAIEICSNALDLHHGTGRLWATLVQLRHFSGRDEAQQLALRRALNAVPKSGEVWCEGGRIHLNPFSDTFDLSRARRHLFFATRFTPQYGDGFVETIRLELIDQWLAPIAAEIWEKTKGSFRPSADYRVESSLTKFVTDVALAVAVASLKDTGKDAKKSLPLLVHRSIVPTIRKRLRPEVLQSTIDLSDLRLACVNADPNYGLLWFHCRRRPTDTPRRIIEDAAGAIAAEVQKYAHIYLAAIIRRKAILSTIETEKPHNVEEGLEITNSEEAQWNEYVDKTLLAAPSLEDIFNPIDPTTGLVLLENTISGPLFVTGLSELNRQRPMSNLSLGDRRRSLFGNDALFP